MTMIFVLLFTSIFSTVFLRYYLLARIFIYIIFAATDIFLIKAFYYYWLLYF